jgi:hypothetical protein
MVKSQGASKKLTDVVGILKDWLKQLQPTPLKIREIRWT